jgi:hypothetical protein
MAVEAVNRRLAERAREPTTLAWRLVDKLGGRYSSELGIDVDAGEAEVERWFLASTLFGNRIGASVVERTFGVLEDAGLVRIGQARHVPFGDLVELLDRGGYTRYDFLTANRLSELSEVVDERYEGQVAAIGRRFRSYRTLREGLDALPGWGPVTVDVFLRELRGVWTGARPPLNARADRSACHLGLLGPSSEGEQLQNLRRLAGRAHVDARDLESALVRLALAHHGRIESCRGGGACVILSGE